MAALVKVSRSCAASFCRIQNAIPSVSTRLMATTPADEKEPGWLSKLLHVRKIDTGKESHSRLLAEKDVVYEMQFHSVKPEFMEEYLKQYNQFVDTVNKKQTGAKLAGSWTVEVGDQDEAIHLWKYKGGYPTLNRATEIYRTDQEFVDFRVKRNQMLRSRKNQILLPFSFWGDIKEREGKWIYELRSYTLKPGTMIEWGNNWAKGIKFRQHEQEPVAGLFTQIGELYTVQHIWAYESLQSRKEVREAAWRRPGWDECVAHTVPLMRHMSAKILIPTPFSPAQ